MNNIQDILTTGQMPVNPYSKIGDDEGNAREDFMALMAGSLNNVGAGQDNNSGLTIKEPAALDVNKELETKVSVSNNVKNSVKDKIKIDDSKAKVTPGEEKKVVEEYGKFEDGVKKVLTEELEVSEEELNSAMETLGLSFVDLTDPKNLALLLNEIKGEDNGVNLLLDTSVSEIFDGMSELTGELLNATGLGASDIADFIEENLISAEGNIELNPNEFEMVAGEEELPVDVNLNTISEAQAGTVSADAVSDKNATDVKDVVSDKDVPANEVASSNLKEEKPVMETETEDSEEVAAGVDALRNKMVSKDDSGQSSSFGGNQNKGQTESLATSNTEPNVTDHTNVGQPTQTFSETIQTVEGETVVTTYTNVNTADVINQIVTQASTTITRDVSTMELLLNPQNLGRMLMQVSEQEGQITAKFITQNEAVKNALEGAIANLIEKLNDQGIKVDAVEVSVGTHEFEENLEKNFQGDTREDLQGQQTGEGNEGQRGNRSRGGIHLGDASYMDGSVLTEEEELEANIMRTYGNTVNFRA